MSTKFVTVLVGTPDGKRLGWIAKEPCFVTGRTDFCELFYNAVEFRDEAAARRAAAARHLKVLCVQHFA